MLGRVQPEQEGGDHPKISTTTPQCPEEIRVDFLAGGDKTAVRQDHIHFEHIVDGQTVSSGDVSGSAAQRQPTHPVVERIPLGAAMPKAWVAWSTSPQVQPA